MITLLQQIDTVCLSIITGAWLKLLLSAIRLKPYDWRHVLAVSALMLMSTSAALMLYDSVFSGYRPDTFDRWMHAGLALWNALVLLDIVHEDRYGSSPLHHLIRR